MHIAEGALEPADDQRGSVSAEFCLCGAVVILLSLVVIQLAMIGYARQAAGYAAHDALTEAQSYGGDIADASVLGRQVLTRLTGALRDAQVHVNAHADSVSVTVTGRSEPVLGYSRTIAVTDTGRIERWGNAA